MTYMKHLTRALAIWTVAMASTALGDVIPPVDDCEPVAETTPAPSVVVDASDVLPVESTIPTPPIQVESDVLSAESIVPTSPIQVEGVSAVSNGHKIVKWYETFNAAYGSKMWWILDLAKERASKGEDVSNLKPVFDDVVQMWAQDEDDCASEGESEPNI